MNKVSTFFFFVLSWILGLAASYAQQSISTPPPPPPVNWADVYNPLALRSFHIAMTQTDWQVIRTDETFEIKVPAQFWMEGDGPLDSDTQEIIPTKRIIEIRRKSATAIGDKVSYRLKFLDGRWYDLQTLSLENGDDNNVITEGLAWHLHRLASTGTYQPGLAAWTTLTLHLSRQEPVLDEFGNPVLDDLGNPVYQNVTDVKPQGVYLNVEFVDKLFLSHRGLWNPGSTWLYKQDDIGLPEIKEFPTSSVTDSPTYLYLDYSPFRATRLSGKRVLNPTPGDAELERQLNSKINMDSFLRLGAVNAFTDNPDELFNKGKNFFWVDYSAGHREYFPWDLDAAIRSTNAGIYGSLSVTNTKRGSTTTVNQHPYQSVILNHPKFRNQYNAILTNLLNGPMQPAYVQTDLMLFEALLTEALLEDPNNKIGHSPEAISSYFAYLRNWISLRSTNVISQIQKNGPPAPRTNY